MTAAGLALLVALGLLCARSLYTSTVLIRAHLAQVKDARSESDEQARKDETEIVFGKLLFRCFRLYTSASGLVLVLLAPLQPSAHQGATLYGLVATIWIFSLEAVLTFVNEYEFALLRLGWPYRGKD